LNQELQSIIVHIKKLLLPALCLLLLSSSEGFAEFGMELQILQDIGYSRSGVSQRLPDGWEGRYEPRGGTMRTDKHSWSIFWDLGLGLAPIWKIKDSWIFGIPMFYTINIVSNSWKWNPLQKTIGRTDVDWWNEVPVLDVQLKKMSPAFGILCGINRIYFQGVLQKYTVFVRDYKGIDVYGDVNQARTIDEREHTRGYGLRFDAGYRVLDADKSSMGIGLFFESDGAACWQLGMRITYGYSVFRQQ
jgi:hypothetical protein